MCFHPCVTFVVIVVQIKKNLKSIHAQMIVGTPLYGKTFVSAVIDDKVRFQVVFSVLPEAVNLKTFFFKYNT